MQLQHGHVFYIFHFWHNNTSQFITWSRTNLFHMITYHNLQRRGFNFLFLGLKRRVRDLNEIFSVGQCKSKSVSACWKELWPVVKTRSFRLKYDIVLLLKAKTTFSCDRIKIICPVNNIPFDSVIEIFIFKTQNVVWLKVLFGCSVFHTGLTISKSGTVPNSPNAHWTLDSTRH